MKGNLQIRTPSPSLTLSLSLSLSLSLGESARGFLLKRMPGGNYTPSGHFEEEKNF
jgi:hypothetical protein